MALLLGALAGVSYGVADFLGGLASSAWRPERVVAAVQGVGIVVALAVLPFVGSVLAPADVAWGAAAGVAGGLGIVALYRALALGPMNVAAPVAAVVGSVVPVAMGLASGERPGPIAAAGVAFGIVAVSLVGSSPHAEAGGGPRRRVALVAALAGLGLGAATVAFGQTSPSAGLWPLLAAKVVTASLVGAVALARPGRDADPRRGRRFAVAGGVADAGATILLVLAVQRGPLSLVGVLVSLYPASTVVLARVLLSERISRPQALGLGLAAAAVAMIAAG